MAEVTVHGPVSADTIKAKVEFRVQTRGAWGDSWETHPYLEPLMAVEQAAPSVPYARLRWRYGAEIKHEDATSFAQEHPLDVRGQFVRIQMIPEPSGLSGQASGSERPVTLWTGILTDEGYDIHGASGSDDAQGDQYLTAFGLEVLLDRVTILGAYVAKTGASKNGELNEDGTDVYVDWCPVFNERYERGAQDSGNMSGQVFGGTDPWSHKDMAEYLLANYGPQETTFTLAGQKDALGDIITRQALEGLTVRQALNMLIQRQRGLGWSIRIDDEQDQVEIHVFTVVGDSVSVGDYSLPANRQQTSFKFDDARDILRAALRIDERVVYDRVVVQGERIKSMFHVSYADGSIEPGWTDVEEEAYQDSIGDDDPNVNDAERKTDRYSRVYRMFRVPSSWDWKMKNGFGTGAEENAAPAFTRDGELKVKSRGAYWNANRAFERFLPIEKVTSKSGAELEYLDPTAHVPVSWGAADESRELFVQTADLDAYDYSPTYIRMIDREFAVELRTHTNHTFALNHWGRFDNEPAATAVDPEVDWQKCIFTVCAKLDQRVKIEAYVSEELVSPSSSVTVKTKVIQLADAELWYVTPGTIYYVLDGQIRRHSGGIVRDDRGRLEAVAAFAKAWYGKERASVTLSLQKLYVGLPVGTYVKDASSSSQRRDVGTVITMRAWDFSGMRTTIRTQYVEIDFVGLM